MNSVFLTLTNGGKPPSYRNLGKLFTLLHATDMPQDFTEDYFMFLFQRNFEWSQSFIEFPTSITNEKDECKREKALKH